MATRNSDLYPFYKSNIHERRCICFIARGLPLSLIVGGTLLAVLGAIFSPLALLIYSAFMNLIMWSWLVLAGAFGILGSHVVQKAVLSDSVATTAAPAIANGSQELEVRGNVLHVVVFPNYKEDEAMLAETLQSLSEARGSSKFWVVLAMEQREGVGAEQKAANLQAAFEGKFARILATFHPADRVEHHLDNSVNPEVPGKSSNLKWAVAQVWSLCNEDPSVDADDGVVLTVSDADCLFHPRYFERVRLDHVRLRNSPCCQHQWTMWQAPQLCYRNYYQSPVPSRAWGYLSSAHEFGCVSSLLACGHHMTFSSFSLSLFLAVRGELWDGDIIADDHHAFLKAFFLSAYELGAFQQAGRPADGFPPRLRVSPVMLPVKSTSVVSSEGYWRTWVARWHQATRHAQGVAELSYAFLALWDMLCTLPLRAYRLCFLLRLGQVIMRLLFIHIVPVVQGLVQVVFTLHWVFHGCPAPADCRFWPQVPQLLGFPIVVPFAMVAFANFRMLRSSFQLPARQSGELSLWHASDAGLVPTCGSRALTLVLLILMDCVIFVAPLMVPYGLMAELVACWNVMIRGNHFTFIPSEKVVAAAPASPVSRAPLTVPLVGAGARAEPPLTAGLDLGASS